MFLQRVNTLFGRQPQCFNLQGYTKSSLQFLESRVHVLKKRGRVLTTLGGSGCVTDEVRKACLGRMTAWLALCQKIIRAEFPCFEIVHSFWIFNVSPHGRGSDTERLRTCSSALENTALDEDADPRQTSVLRLAKVFALHADALWAQFHTCLPVARHRARTLNVGNQQAWVFAVAAAGKRTRME